MENINREAFMKKVELSMNRVGYILKKGHLKDRKSKTFGDKYLDLLEHRRKIKQLTAEKD